MALDDLSPRARALAVLMSDISEDHYAAGWMWGLEFSLWRIVQGGSRRYGMADVSEGAIDALREMSDLCGGWIMYDRENGETFVPLDEWREIYRRRVSPEDDDDGE